MKEFLLQRLTGWIRSRRKILEDPRKEEAAKIAEDYAEFSNDMQQACETCDEILKGGNKKHRTDEELESVLAQLQEVAKKHKIDLEDSERIK